MFLNNYRSISLLSILNKLLEKLIFKIIILLINIIYILPYMQQCQLLTKYKEPLRMVTTLVAFFWTYLRQLIVNRCILLQKLDNYGIRGVAYDWFKSRYDNRKQFVSLGGVSSELLDVTCGVPQVSVLGPLLFLLYINVFKTPLVPLIFTSSLMIHTFFALRRVYQNQNPQSTFNYQMFIVGYMPILSCHLIQKSLIISYFIHCKGNLITK